MTFLIIMGADLTIPFRPLPMYLAVGFMTFTVRTGLVAEFSLPAALTKTPALAVTGAVIFAETQLGAFGSIAAFGA